MNQQDLVAKREPDEDDKSFCELENIKFMDDKELKDFYNNIKCQMKWLFWVNIFFCVVAAVVVVLGIILVYTNKLQFGIILSAAGIISELVGNLFIAQYRNALNKVSEEYYRLLLFSNTYQLLNYAKKLPVIDIRNNELRYLEIREILRAIMKNFDQHI